MIVEQPRGEPRQAPLAPQLSVVLCTHDPRRDHLHRALDSLRAQTLPRASWELVVVDNASRTLVADGHDLTWHAGARHVHEAELGLTAARARGIADTTGELLVFVDDDNVLAPDFLEHAVRLAAQFPFLGVLGAGVLDPEFEVPPPAEVEPFLAMLAVRTVRSATWSNNAAQSALLPWGAGLTVRRSVARLWLRLLSDPTLRVIIGRRGNRLFSGDDDLFSWAAAARGLGFGLFPQLRLTHLIDRRRLTRSHFLKLAHDHSFSSRVVKHLVGAPAPRTSRAWRGARLAYAFSHGFFSVRCAVAQIRGEAAAEALIADSRLQPFSLP